MRNGYVHFYLLCLLALILGMLPDNDISFQLDLL